MPFRVTCPNWLEIYLNCLNASPDQFLQTYHLYTHIRDGSITSFYTTQTFKFWSNNNKLDARCVNKFSIPPMQPPTCQSSFTKVKFDNYELPFFSLEFPNNKLDLHACGMWQKSFIKKWCGNKASIAPMQPPTCQTFTVWETVHQLGIYLLAPDTDVQPCTTKLSYTGNFYGYWQSL